MNRTIKDARSVAREAILIGGGSMRDRAQKA
jgi:hypothetical protein